MHVGFQCCVAERWRTSQEQLRGQMPASIGVHHWEGLSYVHFD